MGIPEPHFPLFTTIYPSLEEMDTHVHLLSFTTDSMIRVGGDYQAQIPEFKPGKLGVMREQTERR